MKKVEYNNKTYDAVSCIEIQGMNFVVVEVEEHRYHYFKETEVNDRLRYIPFSLLIEVLPQFQNHATDNIRNLMDAYIELLNDDDSDVAFLESTVKEILSIDMSYFKNPVSYTLPKQYFLNYFNSKDHKPKPTYEKKSMADLLRLDVSMEKKTTPQEKKNVSISYKKYAYLLLILISFVGFMNCFSIISERNGDLDQTRKLSNELVSNTTIKEVEVEEYTDIEDEFNVASDSKTPTGVKVKNKYGKDYWDYLKVSMMDVDFTDLKKKNSDTVAWLYVNNTYINYPVVQAKDNSYYLNHSFDKRKTLAGWVFADYRADLNNFKRNNVIYGHGRMDQVMFSTLKNVLEEKWYTNPDNYIIKLSTPTKNTLWQVVSVYTIQKESYYIRHDFDTDGEFQEFLNTIKVRSKYDFGVELNANDKILTLSTCYNGDGARVVLHAKLVKEQKK